MPILSKKSLVFLKKFQETYPEWVENDCSEDSTVAEHSIKKPKHEVQRIANALPVGYFSI